MKKLTLSLMAVLMVLAFLPVSVNAAETTATATVTVTATSVPTVSPTADYNTVITLTTRLNEIKAMDVAGMSSVQKRELRKEVRAIKGTLREMDGGMVYISAGGLIVILILLIILL